MKTLDFEDAIFIFLLVPLFIIGNYLAISSVISWERGIYHLIIALGAFILWIAPSLIMQLINTLLKKLSDKYFHTLSEI